LEEISSGETGIKRCGSMDAVFPLTPALSLGEREKTLIGSEQHGTEGFHADSTKDRLLYFKSLAEIVVPEKTKETAPDALSLQ
jgi:hypothetical protein